MSRKRDMRFANQLAARAHRADPVRHNQRRFDSRSVSKADQVAYWFIGVLALGALALIAIGGK